MNRNASFDEAAYLLAHPDVAAAVAAGVFRSGHHHWRRRGRHEGRVLVLPTPPPLPPQPPPPRRTRGDILLGGLDLPNALGLEIGALAAPLVTPDQGRILYVDHADTETLRGKYPRTEIDHDRLVEVDLVWGERSLQECLGSERRVDYVLASHVVEHVPDLVTWLREIAAILVPDGELRLAVPDRRYTFDVLRRESTLADALDAHLRRARAPLPRAILDHFLNVTTVEARRLWRGEVDVATLRPDHAPDWAFALADRCFRSCQYQDTHCWVFTPHSFATLGAALARLALLPMACVRMDPTEPMELEFFARLRRCDDAAECARSWQAEADRLAAADLAVAPSFQVEPPL